MTALRTAILTAALAATTGCATVTKEEALRLGSLEVVHGRPTYTGAVLGAPHGTGDTNTAAIMKLLAQDLGFPGVIARGFTPKETGDKRINVNRPTEGAFLSPSRRVGRRVRSLCSSSTADWCSNRPARSSSSSSKFIALWMPP